MNILSILTPKEINEIGGIPHNAICGNFESDNFSPDFFNVNPDFVDFMHRVIGTKGGILGSLKEAARRQEHGYIYIIDYRTPDGIMGNVPSEDIIGAFKVERGMIVKNSYQRNINHRIYTANGLVKLPQELTKLLIDELER